LHQGKKLKKTTHSLEIPPGRGAFKKAFDSFFLDDYKLPGIPCGFTIAAQWGGNMLRNKKPKGATTFGIE